MSILISLFVFVTRISKTLPNRTTLLGTFWGSDFVFVFLQVLRALPYKPPEIPEISILIPWFIRIWKSEEATNKFSSLLKYAIKKANYSFELRNARSKCTSITIVTTELGFTLKSAYLYVNKWHLDTVYLIESHHGDFL